MRTELFFVAMLTLTTAPACKKDEPKSSQLSATSAAPPAPSSVTGIPECDDYVKASDAYLACPGAADVMKDDSRRSRKKFEARWTNPGDDKQAIAKACGIAAKAALDNLSSSNCKAVP